MSPTYFSKEKSKTKDFYHSLLLFAKETLPIVFWIFTKDGRWKCIIISANIVWACPTGAGFNAFVLGLPRGNDFGENVEPK